MDWLRSEDLKEGKNVTTPIAIIAVDEPSAPCRSRAVQGVPLIMRRIGPQFLDPDSSDRPVAADILLRGEPDEEEEEEEEDEGDGKDDTDDDGYSE